MKTSLIRSAAVAMTAALTTGAALAQDITGAGATFPAPLYAAWADSYNKATKVRINYQSVGSGAGLKQIRSKTVDFGASDMPLKDDELKADGLIQFPTVIGGVVPVVNIKGVQPGQIKLTGQVLGDIYLGKITKWNDAALTALNPGVPLDAAGGMLRVPNVLGAAPLPPAAKIEVDKSDAALRLLDAEGKAYAQFPITSGTAKFPLPIGDWTIESINPDPWYNYDPKLIVNARRGDRKARLPPGPNGPVGTMWMALSKPHYGIHGTPEPGLIGRTQSSGCVRLTNWSAHAVAGASRVGMTVSMVE